MLSYLDETGVGLSLPPTATWTKAGSQHQHRVASQKGSRGRRNLIGSLRVAQETEQLDYARVAGTCRGEAVVTYLDALAAQAQAAGIRTVVVLDNASCHRARTVRWARRRWERQGLFLYYLPPYCPHLNRIETVWRTLKGFLLPRRCYDSLADLDQALDAALGALGAVELQC